MLNIRMYFEQNGDERQSLEIVHSSMLKEEEIPSNFVYFHQTM